MHGFLIILVFAVLIILTYTSPVDPQGETASDSNFVQILEELKASNAALHARIEVLESQVGRSYASLDTLTNDYHFAHPTLEYEYVDFDVFNWTYAFKENLRQLNFPFHTGHGIRAYSTWVFFLTYDNVTGFIGVSLVLQGENYNRGSLFSGFTLTILDSEDKIFSKTTVMPVDFHELEDRVLSLPMALNVVAIENENNALLLNNTLRLRLRHELVGYGHKLYQQEIIPEPPGRDTQTIVFEVKEFLSKFNMASEASSIAHAKFNLSHPWRSDTSWHAEIKVEQDKTVALLVELQQSHWTQLYASFKIEILDKPW